MQKWIRLPMPASEKSVLARHKPANLSWGKYLIGLLNYKMGAVPDHDDKIIRGGK
jgi:hypothetical protein